MADDSDVLHFMRNRGRSVDDLLPKGKEKEIEQTEEESCLAFGFLRGNHDRALTLELRFQTGNTLSFPYSWMGTVTFNPSVGLLIKFTGDLVYLVLIRGSNLDTIVPGRAVNLTDRGINRHRVIWVTEMNKDELRIPGLGADHRPDRSRGV